jgi:predicted phage terminase large subunit-like protein
LEKKPTLQLTADVIKGLVGTCLVKRFDDASQIPKFHEEMWEMCTSKNKFVAIAAPRGHAKSTSISLSYVLASVLFRDRRFVLLVSDTEAQAAMFLGQIIQELQENNDLIELFGIRRDEKGEVKFLKDSATDIIVEFEDGEKFRIIAKGSEQKLRGMLWNGARPDLIVCDDIENDEVVMNKERRDKFKRWVYGALLPCRSQRGIIRIVGTILHMDSFLEGLMPRENDKLTVHEELKTYTTRKSSQWKAVKYKAHNSDFSSILWPERRSAEEFKLIRQDYIERGLADIYSQEYLNIPIDESNTFFKKHDFASIREEDRKKKLNFYIAGDFAISEKERADYTVLLVGGMDENGILHIVNVIRDRLDGLEIVDTMLTLQKVYDPHAFGIEDTQITKAIGPFLNRAMIERNVYINVLPLKPHRADKQTRARSIQARMRAGAVKFDKQADWYQTLEDELMRFPRDKHDDQVDAMAYLGLMIDRIIEAPTKEEMEDEEYEHDKEESELNEEGRSQICGY